MKKNFIVLLMLVVLASSAFAKSSLTVGATAGLDLYWSNQKSKIFGVGLPIFASSSCFFNDSLGLFVDVGVNIGLYTKVNDVETDNTVFSTLAFGGTYKTQLNKDIEVLASLGAELYSNSNTLSIGGVSTTTSRTAYQVILKGQTAFDVGKNVKLLPGMKTTFSFYEMVVTKVKTPTYEKTTKRSGSIFAFALVPTVSVLVEF